MAREVSEGSRFRQAVSQEETGWFEAWINIDFLYFYRKKNREVLFYKKLKLDLI